ALAGARGPHRAPAPQRARIRRPPGAPPAPVRAAGAPGRGPRRARPATGGRRRPGAALPAPAGGAELAGPQRIDPRHAAAARLPRQPPRRPRADPGGPPGPGPGQPRGGRPAGGASARGQADPRHDRPEIPPTGGPSSMTDDPKLEELDKLISMGKQKGYVTYDEVNDALPSDMVSMDQLDDIMMMFGAMDIEVVDSAKAARIPAEIH